MSAHTPGPWGLDPISGLITAVKADGMGIDIATVDLPQGDEERAANARLIQVAPELLEFARLILRGLQGGSIKAQAYMDMDPNAASLELKSVHTLAKQVIAKATGSAPC